MAIEIPTNTALYIPVGPFLDKTDGISPELSITVANSAITLIAGAADETAPTIVLDSVAGNDGTNTLVHITNDDAGMYYLKLTAANNNRYGKGTLIIEDTDTYVTVFHEIQWVSVPYYNWKYGTTLPNVNVTQISGDSDAADNLELAYDGTGYAGGTTKQKVDLETVKTKAITCADAITILASVGTAATSTAQTGDSYAIVNGDHGLVSIKDDIDAILADVGDASGSTLGSLYAILGNAEASLTSRTPAALTANGNMKASLMEILATALTETSGYLAAGFKKFFNVGSPTGTVNSLPDAVPGQTGGLPTTNGTKLNQTVDADMKKINGHTLGGDGSGTPFGPVD